jgi:hypothetical protein
MKATFIFLTLLTLIRCGEETAITAESPTDTVIIRSGTSFGMCVEYCLKDLEIDGTKATFTKSAHPAFQSRFPTRTCRQTITTAKSDDLKLLATFSEFQKVAKTLGCPDCADGGAEYVEIQVGEQKHRVKFEYNRTIPGFENLVKELRIQREAFKNCE